MRFKSLFILTAVVFCLVLVSALAAVHGIDEDNILNAAESLFKSMSNADYPALWSGLTAKSQNSIVKNVRKFREKAGLSGSDEFIRADFEKGGEIARDYWNEYLTEFDPKSVLDESKWRMGEVKRDRAEIILRHRKSEHDSILKLFREGGVWKVGLDESFSTRRQ